MFINHVNDYHLMPLKCKGFTTLLPMNILNQTNITCFFNSWKIHGSMHGVNTFLWMTHLSLHSGFYQMI